MSNDHMVTVFMEIYGNLPRGGPGSAASTARAFGFCPDLPQEPEILDIGCGPGKQTLALAGLCQGNITAVDTYQPFLDRLAADAQAQGVEHRIKTEVADMANLPYQEEQFDLIWSEGAAYIMGFYQALATWRVFLKPGGCLALSEMTLFRQDMPEKVRAYWQENYPDARYRQGNQDAARSLGYEVLGGFAVPESDWWTDFYTPKQARLEELREKYAGDEIAMEVIAMAQEEIDLYREHADCYGYDFYVLRKI